MKNSADLGGCYPPRPSHYFVRNEITKVKKMCEPLTTVLKTVGSHMLVYVVCGM